MSNEDRMAAIHETLGDLNAKMDIVLDFCQRHETRISALERWRSWTTGIGTAVATIFGAVLGLWKVTRG